MITTLPADLPRDESFREGAATGIIDAGDLAPPTPVTALTGVVLGPHGGSGPGRS
ncbi:hypothetical protein [Planobispora longispora]|uniref:hypothetical protein n=1 Tax=Planobispora longispora TaxID=28887 RepID=UPI0036242788